MYIVACEMLHGIKLEKLSVLSNPTSQITLKCVSLKLQ